MNYQEEMCYRDQILSQVRNGKRITPEERLWLATHKVINRTLGYPYLNTDIVHLHPKKEYSVRIKAEGCTYPNRIIPVITVPGGKGKIVSSTVLTTHNGNTTSKKSVKMLGLLLNTEHNEVVLSYQSDMGLLGISFECDYVDDRQHILIRKNSCTGDPSFAMLSEVLSDNKLLYRCKAPTDDSFDSLTFSIEWEFSTVRSM